MAGEATIQELEELEQLISTHPEWKRLAGQLLENGLLPGTAKENDNGAEAAWAAHAAHMYVSGRFDAAARSTIPGALSSVASTTELVIRRSYWKAISIGIAALLLITAGGWWLWPKEQTAILASHTNEISTKRGSLSFVKLPDGTQVWLNTNTSLTYNDDFSGAQREVQLSGEAYFDVTHDSTRPFIIHTGKLNIKVLGTAFNVKSYPADETQEAALIRGRIEVTLNDRPQEKIILKPNEKLVVRANQGEMKIIKAGALMPPKVTLNNISMSHDSIVVETAWMQNKIAFTDETLLYISHMLERRFDVHFHFMNEELKTWSYTGIYQNESLEKILELLSTSQKFNYKIQNNEVIIGQ